MAFNFQDGFYDVDFPSNDSSDIHFQEDCQFDLGFESEGQIDVEVPCGQGGGVSDHGDLTGRDLPNQHPISAITNLQETLDTIPTEFIKSAEIESNHLILTNQDDETVDYNPTSGYATTDYVDSQIDDIQAEIETTKEYIDTQDSGLQSNIDSLKAYVDTQDNTLQGKIDSLKSYVDTQDGNLRNDVDTILNIIPEDAYTEGNELADKQFVNDSINEMAANYVTSTANGDSFATESALQNATKYYYNGVEYSPTKNDYAVVSNYAQSGMPARFLYTGNQWAFQYKFSNLQLSPSQMEALDSGITSEKVASIPTTYVESIVSDQSSITYKNHGDSQSKTFTAKVFAITEDMFDLEYDSTKGVAPYSASYGYTNITISANSGIKWIEGAVYTFVLDEKVATSANRNVRLRIGEDGEWIPMMGGAGTIAAGSTVFVKGITDIFVYKESYISSGALHTLYDTNTTYTINYLISPGIYKSGVGNYAITRYSLCMETPDGTWEKITDPTKTYSTATSKTVNTHGFLLNRILYYNTTTVLANGAFSAANVMYMQSNSIDARYSTNCGTPASWVAGDDFYLIGSLHDDGLFYLDSTQWWGTSLPTSKDGKLYIQIGKVVTTGSYTVTLVLDRLIFYHDGIQVRIYGGGNADEYATVDYVDGKVSDLQDEIDTKITMPSYEEDYDSVITIEDGKVDTQNISEFSVPLTIVKRNDNGCIQANEPVSDADLTNKEYVDTQISDIVSPLSTKITAIEGKIPSAASSTNQLADKAFVNDSISEMAARYVTASAQGASFASEDALKTATKYYFNGEEYTPTVNDYAVVSNAGLIPAQNPARYLYTGSQWAFQYSYSNLQLSDTQMAALDSGITWLKLQDIDDQFLRIADEAKFTSADVNTDKTKLTIKYQQALGMGEKTVEFENTGMQAPSTDEFATGQIRLLTIDKSKTVGSMEYSNTGKSGALVQYAGFGNVNVTTPSADTHATPKNYVDGKLVSITATETQSGDAYCPDLTGEQIQSIYTAYTQDKKVRIVTNSDQSRYYDVVTAASGYCCLIAQEGYLVEYAYTDTVTITVHKAGGGGGGGGGSGTILYKHHIIYTGSIAYQTGTATLTANRIDLQVINKLANKFNGTQSNLHNYTDEALNLYATVYDGTTKLISFTPLIEADADNNISILQLNKGSSVARLSSKNAVASLIFASSSVSEFAEGITGGGGSGVLVECDGQYDDYVDDVIPAPTLEQITSIYNDLIEGKSVTIKVVDEDYGTFVFAVNYAWNYGNETYQISVKVGNKWNLIYYDDSGTVKYDRYSMLEQGEEREVGSIFYKHSIRFHRLSSASTDLPEYCYLVVICQRSTSIGSNAQLIAAQLNATRNYLMRYMSTGVIEQGDAVVSWVEADSTIRIRYYTPWNEYLNVFPLGSYQYYGDTITKL